MLCRILSCCLVLFGHVGFLMFHSLVCVVLCCVVLCCVVLCCVVSCSLDVSPVLCSICLLCCVVSCCVVLCFALLCSLDVGAVMCSIRLRCIVFCCVVFCCPVLYSLHVWVVPCSVGLMVLDDSRMKHISQNKWLGFRWDHFIVMTILSQGAVSTKTVCLLQHLSTQDD